MSNLTNNEKKAQQLILNEIEKALNLLESHLKKFCADTKGTHIPMIYIEQSIKIIKDNYRKGAES